MTTWQQAAKLAIGLADKTDETDTTSFARPLKGGSVGCVSCVRRGLDRTGNYFILRVVEEEQHRPHYTINHLQTQCSKDGLQTYAAMMAFGRGMNRVMSVENKQLALKSAWISIEAKLLLLNPIRRSRPTLIWKELAANVKNERES